MTKMSGLYNQGKLDSIKSNVTFYKNPFLSIDSVRWFYVYRDTLKYKDGKYGTGQTILDPFMEYDGQQIGKWISYYPNGKLFSKGEYAIGAYTKCDAGGPSASGYCYKIGRWNYSYDNGIKMATGVFKIIPKTKMTECGIDTIAISIPTNDWNYYDTNGKQSKDNKSLIEKINNSSNP